MNDLSQERLLQIGELKAENKALKNRLEDILETLETWINSEGSQGKGKREYDDLVWVVANAKAIKGKCVWKEEKDIDSCFVYSTSCGKMFEFVDGNPKDNYLERCPFPNCGKVIKVKAK